MERGSPITGVYWGRFNPPHLGHLSVIRRLRRRCHLVVAVGSAEHHGERRNPFSGAERKEMLRALLAESGILDVRVVAVKDGRSMRWAVENLLRACRPDVVFLSTEREGLARLATRRVRVVRFRRTGKISSTRIRASIAAGRSDWERLTGRSVVRWILEHNGVAKVHRAYAARRREPAPRSRTRRRAARLRGAAGGSGAVRERPS